MRELAEVEFRIPHESGEVFSFPRVPEFKGLARENAELLTGSRLSIEGMTLRELRQQARASTLQQAMEYSSRLGVRLPLPPSESLVIGTGHQPFLFHPGIWIKHLLVHRLADESVTPISLSVDSDAFEEIGVDVPLVNGGLRMIRETLVRAPADVPYESHRAPARAAWQTFLDRVDRSLRTLGEPEIEATFRRFQEISLRVEGAPDIGTFLTAVRRRYEGLRQYLELPASRLGRTPEFLRFFLSILRDSPRFGEVYNRHLDAYRERYNVRTSAQPFPNLERDGTRVELPFWVISGGMRHTVYAERRGRAWTISTHKGSVVSVRDGDGADRLAGIEIRGKALTMTSFARLCVLDLMVHGVGGGRYDRVTDAVIAEYFGIQPPRYAVVTATLHLPLHEHNMDAERRRLQRRLLEIQHNPERAMTSPSPEQQRLIDEKWALIPALDASAPTRRERRQMTQRIREINEALSRELGVERANIELKLRGLTDAPEADAAARHREYPFCFFPPEAIDRLIDGVGVS